MSAEVLTNLESVGDLIGSLMAISEGLDEQSYLEDIILQAHGKAAQAFNVAAAATGSAGHLTHVFEFGTAGITRGQMKFPDPTSQAARLWVHRITGRGGQQDIGYSFRSATNRNPQPTTQETGVPSKYLKKLSQRKYIFWNKAFVMETGMTVENKAKNGRLLFVPFNGQPPRTEGNTTGFIMSPKSFSHTPGAQTKGEFTKFWLGWWASQGGEIIEQDMRASVSYDTEKAEAEASKRANSHKLKPTQTVNISGSVTRSKAWMSKSFGMNRYKGRHRA